MIRIGEGYDVHRLVEGRPCIIGGVHIPHETGLLGHSDADVLLHAVTDAGKRRHRALRGGYAGRRRSCVNRNGERGLVVVGVLHHHLRKVELATPRPAHRHANEPARKRRHEVDVLARRELRRADAVALVLAVCVVRHEYDFAALQRLNGIAEGREAFKVRRLEAQAADIGEAERL